MEIKPNVHVIPGGIVNVYLIVESDGLTLIDTGLSGNARTVLKYITGLGKQPADLKRIILTHSDGDHVGALAALKAATGARLRQPDRGSSDRGRNSLARSESDGAARVVVQNHRRAVVQSESRARG